MAGGSRARCGNLISALLPAFVLTLSPASSAERPGSSGTVSGATALALAGVIAPLSPLLGSAERRAIAMLFAANADIPYKRPVVVTADRIVCRAGNVDITVRNCEVTFGKRIKTVNGSTANEIFATEALAGVPPDGAAGSTFESLAKLSCTIDPNAIRRKDGSGASCTFEATR